MKNMGKYADETKIKAIELLNKGLKRREIMKILGIYSEGAIRAWEKKYKVGGINEVIKDQRGLKATGRPKLKNKKGEIL
jgi:transposase